MFKMICNANLDSVDGREPRRLVHHQGLQAHGGQAAPQHLGAVAVPLPQVVQPLVGCHGQCLPDAIPARPSQYPHQQPQMILHLILLRRGHAVGTRKCSGMMTTEPSLVPFLLELGLVSEQHDQPSLTCNEVRVKEAQLHHLGHSLCHLRPASMIRPS